MYSVGILENDKGFRETLEDFISLNGACRIVFSFGSFRELKNFHQTCEQPDFVLLDIHLENAALRQKGVRRKAAKKIE